MHVILPDITNFVIGSIIYKNIGKSVVERMKTSMTFWPRRANEKLIESTPVLPPFAVKRRLTIPLLGHTGSLAWVTSSIPHIIPYDTRITYSRHVQAHTEETYGAIAPHIIYACVHAYNARVNSWRSTIGMYILARNITISQSPR